MNFPKQPQVGDIVLFTPNPDDSIAKSNHNTHPIPAIITRTWGPICVNLKIIPDCGPMQDRTSVVHVSQNPAGFHWAYTNENDNSLDPEVALLRTRDWLFQFGSGDKDYQAIDDFINVMILKSDFRKQQSPEESKKLTQKAREFLDKAKIEREKATEHISKATDIENLLKMKLKKLR